jgi:hypothetical protein
MDLSAWLDAQQAPAMQQPEGAKQCCHGRAGDIHNQAMHMYTRLNLISLQGPAYSPVQLS